MPPFLSRKHLFAAVYLASLFVFASYLLAQDPPPPVATPEVYSLNDAPVEFYGTVQIANRIAVLINNQLIDLTVAQINADLEPGTLVRVQGAWLEDGTFAATRLDPVPDGVLPGIVAFSGIVENYDQPAAAMWLEGQLFALENAIIRGNLASGDFVSVFAIGLAPNTWSALAVIDLSEDPALLAPIVTPVPTPATTPDPSIAPAATQEVSDDFEFIGAIEQLGDGFIVVNGLRVDITQARIDDTLSIGLVVRVEAFTINDQLVAERVRADD